MKNIEMYTIPNCRYCTLAKNLLASIYKEFGIESLTVHTLGVNDITIETLQEHVNNVVPNYGKVKTVPQIFVDGKLIGGYTELSAYVESKRSESEK